MTKTEYRYYLETTHWKLTRKKVLDRSPACHKCDMPRWLAAIVYDQDLHVHHLSYENVYHEKQGDLQILCPRCHEVETFGRSELKPPKEATCVVCRRKHYNYSEDMCEVCIAIILRGYLADSFYTRDPVGCHGTLREHIEADLARETRIIREEMANVSGA
jgi:hypothetical protein